MEQSRIVPIMNACRLTDLLDNPKVLDQPSEPEISDIRWEISNTDKSKHFVIKVIQTRESSELLSEVIKGDTLTKKWRIKKERAVNLFKLRDNGLLELRITSQRNTSKYKSDIENMWEMVSDFLPRSHFQEVSLNKAKEVLWSQRGSLQDKVRYSDVTLKNDTGNTIKAVTGSHLSNLYEDDAVNNSMEVFYNHEAYCDSQNIWFRFPNQVNDDKPREIHVLLSGEMNEFAITAQCSSQEYEYVYDQLKNFNK